MKLKINKACDVSSISVFPPHTRRPNAVPNGPQAAQLRSQPSEQSFSQGLSSQHNMFSQLSQNSQCDVLTNDQRFGSQERENSVKKVAYFPPISHARDESQLQISRSSTNLMRKWSSASVSDNRLEAMRQKLIAQDNSLQLTIKGQEDFKTSLDGGIKSISEEMGKNTYQDKLQEIFLALSALPEKIGVAEAALLKSQHKLHDSFVKEMQKLLCTQNQSTSAQNCEVPTTLPPKICKMQGSAYPALLQGKPQPIKSSAVPPKVGVQAVVVPKIETGGWKSVKVETSSLSNNGFWKVQNRSRLTSIPQERECRVIIESDEEIDGAFSCLFGEKETDMAEEVMEETERILRRARRRKRKCSNTIIIN